MTTAVNPGSFDPVTNGHIKAITDVAAVFDKVVVAIGVNPAKNYMFSLAEREELMRKALARVPNVEVTAFSGLLVNFMTRNDYDVIVRGLRNGQDFEESLMMETVGWKQLLAEDIKVFYVPARPEHAFTSSTMLKGVLKEQGDARTLAPLSTIQATQARMMGQYFYGVTGVSGSGKSTLCRAFQKVAEQRNIPVLHVDLDKIGHAVLSTEQDAVYQKVRADIKEVFGDSVVDENGQIVRKKLGEIVFQDPEKLQQLNAIVHPAILFRMHDILYGKKGIFLIDTALLSESALESVVNNQALLVEIDPAEAQRRIESRDNLQEGQAQRRASSQLTQEEKAHRIQSRIDADNHGNLDFVQGGPSLTEAAIEQAFDKMLERIDIFGEMRVTGFFKTLGVAAAGDAYTALRKIYSGDDRFYHTLARVVDGLNALPDIAPYIQDKEGFTLAWLFQGAAQSAPGISDAAKAAELLDKMGAEWEVNSSTIMAAKNILLRADAQNSGDAAFFSDFSRRVFGDKLENFLAFETALKREFNRSAMRDGDVRYKAILESMQAAGYKTDYYQKKLGPAAQKNIQQALGAMKP